MAILTETYDGIPGGMNLHLPPQELEDGEARYLQDALVDQPGLVRRRGPVRAIDGFVSTDTPATGLVQTLNPDGDLRLGILHGSAGTGYLGLLSSDFMSKTDIAWNGYLPPGDSHSIASDSFDRIVAAGTNWGTADQGGSWTHMEGTTTGWEVTGGTAKLTPGLAQASTRLSTASLTDFDMTGRVRWTDAASGGVFNAGSLLARISPSTEEDDLYQAILRISNTTQNLTLEIRRHLAGASTNIGGAYTLETNYSTLGDWWWIRLQGVGSALKAKAWRDGSAEPGSWQIETTDSSHTSGLVGYKYSFSAGNVVSPVVYFDSFSVEEVVAVSTAYRVVDAKSALGGGSWIGTSSEYDSNDPVQTLALWKGGNKADYSTGTLSTTRDATTFIGSTTVTGSGTSWVDNAAPGMFLFANTDDPYSNVLIGVVKSVESNTSLTLVDPAPHVCTAKGYTLKSIRGFNPKVGKGRVTCATSAATVNGAQTKFKDQGLDTVIARSGTTTNTSTSVTGLASTSDLVVGMGVFGTGIPANTVISAIPGGTSITLSIAATASGSTTLSFRHAFEIYRASDNAYIGRVTTITSNLQVTLTANAKVALNNERYVALNPTGDWSINTQAVADKKVGFLNSQYADRQWFANLGQRFETTVRCWFSDPADGEVIDLTNYDGDFIDLPSASGVSSPIRALCPAYNALVVLKDNEAYGIFGSSTSTFSPKKIEDDGTLSGMSVQPFGGGVIWAGRNGIWFFDGIQPRNLTAEKLGDYYRNAVRSFDPSVYRMWSMVIRDHYFLHMEFVEPNVAVIKGVDSITPSHLTIAINMTTGAVTTMTNVRIRGSIVLPATTGQSTWYLANSSIAGFLCDASDIFDETGADTLACDGGSLGPDFYMESKKFKAGDSLRKKLFKQLAINYISQGSGLTVDTVVGLNNIGSTSNTELPETLITWAILGSSYESWDVLASATPTWGSLVTALFRPRRIKFLKRNQHFAFRIYQSDSDATRVVLGPFQIGYKLQRPGRI